MNHFTKELIFDELESVRESKISLAKKLQEGKLSFVGKRLAKEIIQILIEIEEVFEIGKDTKKIEELINALPLLALHISGLVNEEKLNVTKKKAIKMDDEKIKKVNKIKVNVTVEAENWEEFKRVSKENNRNASQLIRDYIEKYLAENEN